MIKVNDTTPSTSDLTNQKTMATTRIPQPPFLSPLTTINSLSSPPKPTTLFSFTPSLLKPFKLSSSLIPSNAEPSQPTSSPNPPQASSEPEPDPVKLAFERAKAYKKKKTPQQPNPTNTINEYNQVPTIEEIGNGNGVSNSGGMEMKPSIGIGQNQVQEFDGIGNENGGSDSGSGNVGEGQKEVPVSVKIAMERAKKYKKNGGIVGGSGKEALTGLKEGNKGGLGGANVEKRVSKKEKQTISSIDFVGLGFADKKEGRGLPAGLVPVADTFSEGDLAEVEFIAGDPTMFGEATTSNTKLTEEESSDLYKPKVSTWGVFPRPSNISKTFGGGRVVRPGEVLETDEDKAAKVKRTRQLLVAYKKRMGLDVDPKLKSECEKALKDGDSLMDLGKLKEALPYYEKVMNKLPFQNEIHGLAALQWSICQDSLNRTNEARLMYERLQSHPNVPVSKKARQFMFSFQAMEMMRVTSSSLSSKATGYQSYFEAFIGDKANYPVEDAEVEEGALSQSFPYILFLLSPIFMVLLIAVQKRL